VISARPLFGVGVGYTVTWPWGVTRPIRGIATQANQMFPSAPTASPYGALPVLGTLYAPRSCPDGLILAIVRTSIAPAQLLPSGPRTGPRKGAPGPPKEKVSATPPGGVLAVIRLSFAEPVLTAEVNQTVPSGATVMLYAPKGSAPKLVV